MRIVGELYKGKSQKVDNSFMGDVGIIAPAQGAELSVIVPTFNERENIKELVRQLDKCLVHQSWEIIFVDDDSPDETTNIVREIGQRDWRVRCIQRIGRRGLSSACIEGMLASSAAYLAVIDGDLQHDEKLLPQMLEILKRGEEDIIIGSRYVTGGSLGNWEQSRTNISRFATRLSKLVVRANIKDPMSGFFMISRQAFSDTARNLSGIGFKIMIDLFASSPAPLRFKELPYTFRSRKAGESKLDSQVAWDYGMLLVDKLIGKFIPVHFIAFSMVGGLGVFIHLLTLTLLFRGLKVQFVISQVIATFVAMTSNYTLNNIITYRNMRLKGWKWLHGWISFTMACSVGALANVGIASYLFSKDTMWLLSALAGILVGVVWNYSVTKVYTWGKLPKGRG